MSRQITGPNPYRALVAMHGPPEITGLALKESCDREPIEGWDVEIANAAAVEAGTRYVTHNMALQFPGDSASGEYERWRAAQIWSSAQEHEGEFELMLEIHDRPDATGEYVATNGTYQTRLLRVAAQLGIWSIVNWLTAPMLGNHVTHSLTVELCRDDAGDPASRLAENVERLRACMQAVAADDLPDVDPADFAYYDYQTEINWEQAKALGLDRLGTIEPFEPLPASVIELLRLRPGRAYVAEYWNGVCSAPGEWFGGVLRRRRPPILLDDPLTASANITNIKRERLSGIQAEMSQMQWGVPQEDGRG